MKNKVKIGFIGHFGINNNNADGQTVKTLEINNYIEDYYRIKTDKLDTTNISRNIFDIYFKVRNFLINNDIIFLIVSNRGYKVLAPMLAFLNKIYKKRIYDVVIGGNRFNLYTKNNFWHTVAYRFNCIFVETVGMVKEYNSRNLHNVKILKNFKNIKMFNIAKFQNKPIMKLCTFTRVCLEKGIEDAINSVTLANKKIGKNVFELDIYGTVANDYKERFKCVLAEMPDYVNYKGTIDSKKSSEVITNYDYMLFLTFWVGEGLPGTIIDSFFAGTPIIATDWNYNFEVLEEKVTGLKVPVNDVNAVSDILINIFNNQKKYYTMRYNCAQQAKQYLPDNVMKELIEEIDIVPQVGGYDEKKI